MGQAKRRGSFDLRREQAIRRDRQALAALQEEISRSRGEILVELNNLSAEQKAKLVAKLQP